MVPKLPSGLIVLSPLIHLHLLVEGLYCQRSFSSFVLVWLMPPRSQKFPHLSVQQLLFSKQLEGTMLESGWHFDPYLPLSLSKLVPLIHVHSFLAISYFHKSFDILLYSPP